jgi:hypothetical protein
MTPATVLLAIASAVAVNWAYVREQGAASSLPPLSFGRPLESLELLLANRGWLGGFATETIGFLCFVGALALAPLALVQSLAAGGVAVLAFLAARLSGTHIGRRERVGVAIAVTGLALLGISLAGGTSDGTGGGWLAVVAWVVASGAIAALAARRGARLLGPAAASGVAAGLLFAAGDVTTETVTRGGSGLVLLPVLFAAYGFGTVVLQLGFQRGGALTTAGTAALFSDALPIAAGTVVYAEPFPDGMLGVVRGIAFVVLVLGAVALSRPEGMIRPGCPQPTSVPRRVTAGPAPDTVPA